MEWSNQQEQALAKVAAWHKHFLATGKQQVCRIFGYAGTGKTTLARHFAKSIDGDVRFAAFTGKAALMMERSGCESASTIHAMIYNVRSKSDGRIEFKLNKDGPASDAALIIIDECSMVDEEVGQDLLSFGKPILVLGDPAQLPPVKGAGYFTNVEPDVMLTEIHRQAKGNPIIELATAARCGEKISLGDYGTCQVIQRGTLAPEEVLAFDQIIVGRNATRKTFNRRVRTLRGMKSPLPKHGDQLVCLRNDNMLGIQNGGLFSVDESRIGKGDAKDCLLMSVLSHDFEGCPPIDVRVRREFFEGGAEAIDWRELRGTQQFDYGYALTAHKAQGSQWANLLVYDESAVFRDDRQRWLYTAITRASDKLTLVVD